MQVKLNQAVKMFFGNSSLEMIYFEAIANALDADATQIDISIYIDNRANPKTLKIEIKDNGVGFTDERYKKFSRLFDVEENSHKGLGRLVYLFYFNSVRIQSFYEKNKKREFEFKDEFDEEKQIVSNIEFHNSGTTLSMTGYTLQKLAKYDYIQPEYLKTRFLEEFYSILFKRKKDSKSITINIKANIENQCVEKSINEDDILDLEEIELDTSIDLVNKLYLYYAIKKIESNEKSLISAISIDNRTLKYEIVSSENIPLGYKMVFLLFSDYFTGRIDLTRQNINFPPNDEKRIKELFRKKVSELIEKNIPSIAKRNKEIGDGLVKKYPHLSGYFNSDEIGYISRENILKKAQESFFKDQKELLETTSLDDNQFEKAIEVSSRALTEYILFRQVTIENLKKINNDNSEAELHKLFATMRTQFHEKNKLEDLYRNNAWVLDDKYMTYKTVLSDKKMQELIGFITNEEVEKDLDRPDLALVFSRDPSENIPFDVVVVELKKRNISLEENMKVVTQLEKRARKLMKYYDNKIQRIWFYGIIEFNSEVELALSGEYTKLYSSGKMYYKETKVAISLEPEALLPVGIYIWDLDAVIDDADTRNSTFLELIKSKFIVE